MDEVKISALFLDFCQSFPREDMIELKIMHTRRVVENAIRIMEHEGFSAGLYSLGVCTAWLHDVGRFQQFQRYRTFSDRQSVDHALLGCSEVLRLGWLDSVSATERNLVLHAIASHNLRDLPERLSEDEYRLSALVRDADKLDIFRVLDQAIESGYLTAHPEIYWGLPIARSPSEAVVAAVREGKSVDYADVCSLADFVFIQLAWCSGGLVFAESLRMALARKVVETRRDYLCTLLPGSTDVICQCCSGVLEKMKRRLEYGA